MPDPQENLFDETSDLTALDQLFQETKRYRTSAEFREVLDFSKRFRSHAPYNCFLLHMQNRDAKYVANAQRWRKVYGRTVKQGARPLIILVPFGPVDFVYDIRDTEGNPVPESLVVFLGAKGTLPSDVWNQTRINCARESIALSEVQKTANAAGVISTAASGQTVDVQTGFTSDRKAVWERRPARYSIELNKDHSVPTRYATLVHELAHLFCGHLGTPNPKWWPDRRSLSLNAREFEAESVSWLVTERLGIANPSARYLDGYLQSNREVPNISLELILKVAGYVERMGRETIKIRKDKEP